jgi:hypothetical protein
VGQSVDVERLRSLNGTHILSARSSGVAVLSVDICVRDGRFDLLPPKFVGNRIQRVFVFFCVLLGSSSAEP